MARRLLILLAVIAVAASGARYGAARDGADDTPRGERLQGRVTRVVDGDTIKVRVRNHTETVRLIGIDTPETHRPDTPVECGGRAATRAMQRLADGRRVTLVPDPTQDDRDRYDRLLAYADAATGDLGEQLLRSGWGAVYVYDGVPFERVGRYRRAARQARDAGRGIWRACGGDPHRG
jgi:micrococcal nuclease